MRTLSHFYRKTPTVSVETTKNYQELLTNSHRIIVNRQVFDPVEFETVQMVNALKMIGSYGP